MAFTAGLYSTHAVGKIIMKPVLMIYYSPYVYILVSLMGRTKEKTHTRTHSHFYAHIHFLLGQTCFTMLYIAWENTYKRIHTCTLTTYYILIDFAVAVLNLSPEC